MIPGDRVRLTHAYGSLATGSEGVIESFYRNESGENVIVHFEDADEMIPWTELEVVEAAARPRDPSPFDWLIGRRYASHVTLREADSDPPLQGATD